MDNVVNLNAVSKVPDERIAMLATKSMFEVFIRQVAKTGDANPMAQIVHSHGDRI